MRGWWGLGVTVGVWVVLPVVVEPEPELVPCDGEVGEGVGRMGLPAGVLEMGPVTVTSAK